MTIKELAKKILLQFATRTYKNRPFIVAIDGLSGAGKSTLVKKIEQELSNNNSSVVILHIDDHIEKKHKRYETGREEWYEYYYLQWDIKMLTTSLFEGLRNNKKNITLPFYDKSSDTISAKQITVAVDSIILIEGIFLQRKEWREFYDYTIFLDCPRELRYERVLNRDSYIGDKQAILLKYKRRYWLGEEHYLNTENPIKNADIVI
ncbi:kinase [Viridibacillus sp. FSL R5-0477]|uniref:Uridine kinase n=1 Tax=Viridibacillus arenosi FSL R5-213 TaxID=1227360 RepID=W4EQ87_9BACL|nr:MULTISPECIES: kinase [Viridibacillus]ETT82409.1 uridine kinase [Viridibacillus arenosi FSL R5-213]OMC85387.1 uridine kinase [Viridibacillus sp. FSL H8-0123]OMC87335.1 uridine kinase [Viridibacillus sp. FSL H7-0596]OMC92496.1 uridine kinase [Viridibacillus arenosi]